MTSILYTLEVLITSSICGANVEITLPSLSSIRVTNKGATRIPLLAKAVYALTISPTEISQGPRQSETTGSMALLRTPKLWISRTNSYGFSLPIR